MVATLLMLLLSRAYAQDVPGYTSIGNGQCVDSTGEVFDSVEFNDFDLFVNTGKLEDIPADNCAGFCNKHSDCLGFEYRDESPDNATTIRCIFLWDVLPTSKPAIANKIGLEASVIYYYVYNYSAIGGIVDSNERDAWNCYRKEEEATPSPTKSPTTPTLPTPSPTLTPTEVPTLTPTEGCAGQHKRICKAKAECTYNKSTNTCADKVVVTGCAGQHKLICKAKAECTYNKSTKTCADKVVLTGCAGRSKHDCKARSECEYTRTTRSCADKPVITGCVGLEKYACKAKKNECTFIHENKTCADKAAFEGCSNLDKPACKSNSDKCVYTYSNCFDKDAVIPCSYLTQGICKGTTRCNWLRNTKECIDA